MADWFNELVVKTCAEVLASEHVRLNLALADPARVTATSITRQIVGPGGDTGRLLELLAEPIGAVERIDRQRDGMIRELLPRESRAVADAEARLKVTQQLDAAVLDRALTGGWGALRGEEIWDSLSAGARTAWDSVRRRLRPGRSVTDLRAEVTSAETALGQAQQAFAAAAADERIIQHPLLRQINDQRAEAVSVLRGQLGELLAQRINLIIDDALTASYEPEFSFSGSAWLVDQPVTDADMFGAEVNGEAVTAIRNMIDSGLTGAIGVAGARGIGKTTLLTRFARSVPDLWPAPPWEDGSAVRQWGVAVAAPAQYEARDFLLHTFGQLCASVLGEARVRELENEMTEGARRPGQPRLLAAFASYLAVAALLCGALVIGLETSRPVGSTRSMADLLIAGCCAVAGAKRPALVGAAVALRKSARGGVPPAADLLARTAGQGGDRRDRQHRGVRAFPLGRRRQPTEPWLSRGHRTRGPGSSRVCRAPLTVPECEPRLS
jgi:hypothetical protein